MSLSSTPLAAQRCAAGFLFPLTTALTRTAPTAVALAVAALWLTPRAPAQAWKIPARGAAIYDRETDWQIERLDGQPFVSHGGHLVRVPPLALAAEFAAGGQELRRPPFDLLGIPSFLAFDRPDRHRGAVVEQIGMLYGFGDVTLRGRAERIREGVDRIVVEISRRPARPADAGLAESMEHYMADTVEGEIAVERTWDAERGAVGEIVVTADLRYTDTSGEDRYRYRRTGSERWTLRGFRTGQDPEFGAEVDEAIDGARDYLLKQLEDPRAGSMAGDEVPGPVHGPALVARSLRGLADAGVGRDHPTVARAFEDLFGRDMRHPRALSESILALAAFDGTAVAEREQTRAQGAYPTRRRLLSAADLRQVKTWTRALLDARDRHFEWPGMMVWGFHADHLDHASVWPSTRAIEALLLADRCGVEFPRGTWDAAAAGLLDGPFRPGDGGWCNALGGIHHDWSQGHTTAAAVAALRGLRARVRPPMQKRIDGAVEEGLRWLAEHFEPRFDPSAHPVFWQHQPEWCEALPAALERCGVEELGGRRDWYFEMAQCLLTTRRKDGLAGQTVAGTPAALSLWRRGAAVPTTGPRGKDR